MTALAIRYRLLLALLVLPCGLVACGGGGDNGGLFVTQMAATTLQYSRNMTITVSGSGLDKGLTVTVDKGCGAVTESAGGDALTRRFTCKVTELGPKTIRAYTADKLEAARLQVTVPEPEVTFILQGLDTGTSTFTVKLDPQAAPISVNNFLDYANAGFYRPTIFHRVVKDFVVQAGGYTAGALGPVIKTPTSPAIALESNNGLKNVKGSIAMARTSDPNSATTQFYINTVDNPSLDYKSPTEPGYAVFGAVVTGLDVIERLNAVPVRVDLLSGLTHLPVTNVTIISALQTK
ncbi:MAG: Peptidyl-prolyl cis-trans isomerase precursor [Pseudomonadota bacterium]|jgi:peptidyl-prolyl cis-trans isomerase A (cyclophilin A)